MIRLRPGYLISAPSIGKLPVVDGRVNYIRSGRPMDYPKLCAYRFTLIAFPVSNGRRHVVWVEEFLSWGKGEKKERQV